MYALLIERTISQKVNIFEGKPESKRYEWTIAHVKAILKSEVYIGNSVHNMQSTVSFKSKKKVRKPESEWFRVESTHEPIIDKEVFYRVQEQIKSRRRQTKEKATPIFAGLVKCADCGWSMRFGTNKANKTPYSYYACSYYGQFGKVDMVSVDLEIVLQVFENLLSNAMRYADTAVSVACRTKGKKLLITVADDGKGFNSNALKIATDPFYTTEKKSEGEHFGLGLNISKVLCQRHGGGITLKNQKNGGASITVCFGMRSQK